MVQITVVWSLLGKLVNPLKSQAYDVLQAHVFMCMWFCGHLHGAGGRDIGTSEFTEALLLHAGLLVRTELAPAK